MDGTREVFHQISACRGTNEALGRDRKKVFTFATSTGNACPGGATLSLKSSKYRNLNVLKLEIMSGISTVSGRPNGYLQ